MTRPVSGYTAEQLIEKLAQTRARLRALISCLPEEGWLGPKAEHLNPPLWEYGHIVWFQERWCLRAVEDGSCRDSMLKDADALYDSSTVPHDTRWSLPLLDPPAVDDYAGCVADAIAARLRGEYGAALAYFAELCLYHELMHIEAWWMAWQNLGYPPPYDPDVPGDFPFRSERLRLNADMVVLGSSAEQDFIFDNEKWAHPVSVAAFDIDVGPVSEAAFSEFVEVGGYRDNRWWSEAGQQWKTSTGASHPLYWMQENGDWKARRYDRVAPLALGVPMLHVNRFEAEAYAAWRGRRLPTAAQWVRATAMPGFRWGQVWEWLREPFAPYPGFSPDPYRDYSQPWFHTHWELRGGGPVTDPALKRSGFRNFYMPHRRDPFAGFRTVAEASSAA
jgi:ergothioneine biosynthesis protein EgtB